MCKGKIIGRNDAGVEISFFDAGNDLKTVNHETAYSQTDQPTAIAKINTRPTIAQTFPKFKVQPIWGFNFGTITLGSFRFT